MRVSALFVRVEIYFTPSGRISASRVLPIVRIPPTPAFPTPSHRSALFAHGGGGEIGTRNPLETPKTYARGEQQFYFSSHENFFDPPPPTDV